MIRKSDVILLAAVLVAGAVAFAANSAPHEPGAVVKVNFGRETYGTFALSPDREVRIETDAGLNVIQITDGTVRVTEATCAGGDCMKQKPIGGTGQSIVCLPNKVLISIEGAVSGEVDSITY